MEQNTTNGNQEKLPFTQNNHKVDIVKNQYNYKEVNLKTSSVLPLFLQKIKEYISLFMTIWGVLGTLFTVLIFLWIWYFLGNIGARDLYLQSIVSVNTLALVLITAFILALTTLGIIFPSLYVVCLTTASYKDKKPPLILLVPYLGAPFLFLIATLLILIKCDDSYWALSTVLVSPLLFTGGILFIKFKKEHKTIYTQIYESLEPVRRVDNNVAEDKKVESQKKADMFGICLFLVIMCWISMIPLIFINDMWIYKIDNYISILHFIFCIMLGYAPGGVYLFLCYLKTSLQKITIIMILTVIGVAVLEMCIFPIKIKTTVFKSAGIYQENEQVFLLLNTQLKKTISEKFFIDNSKRKIDKQNLNEELEEFQKNNLFRAYTLYYLGNVRLICKNAFDPDLIKQTDKNQLLNSCFSFKPDEIRRIYKVISIYDKLNFKLTKAQIQWLKNFEEITSIPPTINSKFKNFKELVTYNIEQWQEYSKNANSKITTNIPYDE